MGPVEILITNTGGPPVGAALGLAREQWEAAYRDLAPSPLALIERVVPGMRERRWVRIVGVSSTAAAEPIDGLMLSNAHRTGTRAAFKTLSRELARDEITLNTLLTGRILTDRIIGMAGSVEAAERAAEKDGAGRPAGDGRGVRGGRHVPVLGVGVVRHGDVDPRGRRAHALPLGRGAGAGRVGLGPLDDPLGVRDHLAVVGHEHGDHVAAVSSLTSLRPVVALSASGRTSTRRT